MLEAYGLKGSIITRTGEYLHYHTAIYIEDLAGDIMGGGISGEEADHAGNLFRLAKTVEGDEF